MTSHEKMPTIRRDVIDVYRHIECAKDMARAAKQDAIWNELDRAEARLQGLSMFIGPWEAELTREPAT